MYFYSSQYTLSKYCLEKNVSLNFDLNLISSGKLSLISPFSLFNLYSYLASLNYYYIYELYRQLLL